LPIIFLKASRLVPPITSFWFSAVKEFFGVRPLERNIAIVRQPMEKIIKEIGPNSEMELFPHISVEKYLATLDPKKAPNEPPALITPKTLLASSVLK